VSTRATSIPSVSMQTVGVVMPNLSLPSTRNGWLHQSSPAGDPQHCAPEKKEYI
jgi:hypothetical protein